MKKVFLPLLVLILTVMTGCASKPAASPSLQTNLQTSAPAETTAKPAASTPSSSPAAPPSAPAETPAQASQAASPSPSTKPASGGILSNFTATDLNGHFVTADVWKDHKLTMVNIWATFCGPCINEMPELSKLSAAYKDKDVQIVGIVADSSDDKGVPIQDAVDLAKQIVAKTGANYEHILASADLNKLLLNDVSAVPTTIFVDENGKQVGTAETSLSSSLLRSADARMCS